MNRKKRITEKLLSLNPDYLDVIDNSASHSSHFENTEDGTHFTIKISSEKLKEISRIEQHKIINKLLADEFDSGLHALSIQIVK